jgi:hypothetical protein
MLQTLRSEEASSTLQANERFAWPSTHIIGGRGDLSSGVFNVKEGLLSHCGYSVGTNGMPVDKRRIILIDIFQKPLPPISDINYAREWGEPNSGKRLQKIAESIAYI